MRIVIALGGNALLRRGQPMTADNQRANIRVAAERIAAVAAGNELVIAHGNGPQVGLLALQAEAFHDTHRDVAGARHYDLQCLLRRASHEDQRQHHHQGLIKGDRDGSGAHVVTHLAERRR